MNRVFTADEDVIGKSCFIMAVKTQVHHKFRRKYEYDQIETKGVTMWGRNDTGVSTVTLTLNHHLSSTGLACLVSESLAGHSNGPESTQNVR